MALARNTSQRNGREAEKPERISKVRNAMETTTMAAAASVSVDKPLTDRQKLFAKFHAEGDSIPNAMQRAGYNEQPSYGYRLDKMPNVRALIRQEQAKYAEVADINRRKVIDMHMEAFEMAKLMAEPASMVSAAREIGKICGHYETKVSVNISGSVQHEIHRYEQMSDEELIKFLSEHRPDSATQQLEHSPEEMP